MSRKWVLAGAEWLCAGGQSWLAGQHLMGSAGVTAQPGKDAVSASSQGSFAVLKPV